MYHHRITYTPEPEYTKRKAWADAIKAIVLFAAIGALLAWRG